MAKFCLSFILDRNFIATKATFRKKALLFANKLSMSSTSPGIREKNVHDSNDHSRAIHFKYERSSKCHLK